MFIPGQTIGEEHGFAEGSCRHRRADARGSERVIRTGSAVRTGFQQCPGIGNPHRFQRYIRRVGCSGDGNRAALVFGSRQHGKRRSLHRLGTIGARPAIVDHHQQRAVALKRGFAGIEDGTRHGKDGQRRHGKPQQG